MHKLVQEQWENASKMLNSIDVLIIFGFNFNEYDVAVFNLLRDNNLKIKKVIIYDIESKRLKAQLLWPNATIKEHNVNELSLFG